MSDWPSYNESLVRRGQVLLDFDVLDRWDQELFQMDLGKIGEPYLSWCISKVTFGLVFIASFVANE